MSNDKIAGVFVRLPLSNEQRMVANEAPYKSDRKGSALEASILAIGTPVVNSDVEAVCSIDESILRDIRDLDENDEEYVTDMVFRPDYTGETVALVRQSDHLAALAQRDAEIARLRAKQPLYDRVIQENGELKLDVARLQKPEFYGTESQDIGSDDISSLFEFCQNNEVIEINGYRCVSTQFGFFDGIDVHLYNNEAEAVSAALALKGPEA